MHTVKMAFNLALLAILIYVCIVFYLQYRKQDVAGTTWQKIIGAAKGSQTILWSQFCIAIAAVIGQLDNLVDFLGFPEAKTFINDWVGNPKAISAVMLVIAVVTIKARLRPASNDPVK